MHSSCHCLSLIDVLFTGTADGKILKIENGKISTLARLGHGPCGKQTTYFVIPFILWFDCLVNHFRLVAYLPTQHF